MVPGLQAQLSRSWLSAARWRPYLRASTPQEAALHSSDLDSLRQTLREARLADEHHCVERLIAGLPLDDEARDDALSRARDVVRQCREERHPPLMDELLREFALASEEGVLLMCLAESLLRVPDGDTADRLIADRLAAGRWDDHRDPANSRLVNVAVWGLALTGRWVDIGAGPGANPLQRLIARLGEPLVRNALRRAVGLMGDHYVFAEDMAQALVRAAGHHRQGLLHSFDMLGEGARSAADADHYHRAYADSIATLSASRAGGVGDRPEPLRDGISVKLSALHPRYEFAQRERVRGELLPRLRQLCLAARDAGVGMTIDAEEAERLELSLELLAALVQDPGLSGWNGLGVVVQAYQKRAATLCHWLVALARDSGRYLSVRLVKGAYWDSEIKRAQQLGLRDYPVFTRKVHTDLSYLACAQVLLDAAPVVYPQFATHNALTLAMVGKIAAGRPFELQRLHGMGEPLYRHLPDLLAGAAPPVRIYAPVGRHRELLPYLVRRLLENGANSSFIHHFLDRGIAPDALLPDPVREARRIDPHRHPGIPRPRDLYRCAGESRTAAAGVELDDAAVVAELEQTCDRSRRREWRAAPIIAGRMLQGQGQPVTSPADRRRVAGRVRDTTVDEAREALAVAVAAQPAWDALGAGRRAEILDAMADGLEARCHELVALLADEAGRTLRDGVDEVREAVDFCRYYGLQVRTGFAPRRLPGPSGEDNRLTLHGRGVFLCISPWSFPLAIFTGQLAAALAAGNTVLAKPAEATPLIAAEVVRLFLSAGVPPCVLQLLPGSGPEIGAVLLPDRRIAGVAFTGATATAQHINRQLAARDGAIAALIAETGGQNVMLVDSTALPEQVVDDVMVSAFHSAGQRCSALRVLFVQDEIADDLCARLAAALAEQRLGDPARIDTDIGPVIDEPARLRLLAHIRRMEREARLLGRLEVPAQLDSGTFVAPHIFAIDRLDQLTGEVFGPILHIIRYRHDRLDDVIDQINASGYGLTLGVHSRIAGFAREIFSRTRVGNTYVNRTMVGAVVGTQPFGGQGLSGTGPKTGGPFYLPRFATEKTWSENLSARGGDPDLLNLEE